MFEDYLMERVRVRAVARRRRWYAWVATVAVLMACGYVNIGHRLSIEALPGSRGHFVFVASFSEPLPSVPPLALPLAVPRDEPVCGGLDDSIMREALDLIDAPSPSEHTLRQTPTGRHDPHSGTVTVDYCVDARGRVVEASLARRFGEDRQIDRIVLETVERWRFAPLRDGRRADGGCGTTRFVIEFE